MARAKYTDEMIAYLREIAPGKFKYEIAEVFNEKFNTDYTASQIRTVMQNRKINSGMQHALGQASATRIFTDEMIDFVELKGLNLPSRETTKLLNAKFGTDFKVRQIVGLKHRQGIKSGYDASFKKGYTPAHKGTVGLMNVGGNKTSFKKGHITHNIKPIGSETVTKTGVVLVKVKDDGPSAFQWQPKHRVVWEQANGPIPKGYRLIHLDNDPTNYELSNLRMLTHGEATRINRFGLRLGVPELMDSAIQLSNLKGAIIDKEKNLK